MATLPAGLLRFTVSLPGQQPLSVRLQRLATDVSDWRAFWASYFAPIWYRQVEIQYTIRKTATGQPWPALSPAYAAWKQRHWPGLPPGVLSGALRESLTVPGSSDAVWVATPKTLTVGSTVPYGIYQQRGTRRMPARPPLRVTRTFILEVGRLLQAYAHDTVKKARSAA